MKNRVVEILEIGGEAVALFLVITSLCVVAFALALITGGI